jgi:hypothetical protein
VIAKIKASGNYIKFFDDSSEDEESQNETSASSSNFDSDSDSISDSDYDEATKRAVEELTRKEMERMGRLKVLEEIKSCPPMKLLDDDLFSDEPIVSDHQDQRSIRRNHGTSITRSNT